MQEYADIVAHATHSLTLNEIRAFFKADVDEYNGIPIVNFNLTDNQTVLPNAPYSLLFYNYLLFKVFLSGHVRPGPRLEQHGR